jgi:origin recognition complex subunit 5
MSNLWAHIINAWRVAIKRNQSKIDDIGDAIEAVRGLLGLHSKPLYIVVDPVDSSLQPDMLEAIMRFPALARAPIGVILISSAPWQQLFTILAVPEPKPQEIHFPAYKQEELLSILADERSTDIPSQLYESFLRAYIKPACHASRQLNDVRTLARELSPWLRQAIASSDGALQSAQIVQRLRPHAQNHMRHFCENYPGCPVDIRQLDFSRPDAPKLHSQHNAHARPDVFSMDIPFLSKFLLLAAFLSAHNRASADRRVFSSAAGAKQRRKNTQAPDRQAEAAQEESVSQGHVRFCEQHPCFWLFPPLSGCSVGCSCLDARYGHMTGQISLKRNLVLAVDTAFCIEETLSIPC